MKLELASIAARQPQGPAQQLVDDYLRRIQPYFPIAAAAYRSESALLETLEKTRARTPPVLILLDRAGQPHTSEQWATLLDRHRQAATQLLVFAIGPANGWSPSAHAAARETLSFGPITLPHELARVLLAEQLYRAATILAGHPYHSGH